MTTRQERISQMLDELRKEITAGLLEGSIQTASFWFYVLDAPIYVPNVPNSTVFCEFRTSRVARPDLQPDELEPRLSFTPQNVDRSGFSRRRFSAQARAPAI